MRGRVQALPVGAPQYPQSRSQEPPINDVRECRGNGEGAGQRAGMDHQFCRLFGLSTEPVAGTTARAVAASSLSRRIGQFGVSRPEEGTRTARSAVQAACSASLRDLCGSVLIRMLPARPDGNCHGPSRLGWLISYQGRVKDRSLSRFLEGHSGQIDPRRLESDMRL